MNLPDIKSTWAKRIVFCSSLLILAGCQPPSSTPKEQILTAQHQTFMHQQPVAPVVHWQAPAEQEDTSAMLDDDSASQAATAEHNIQFLYPQIDAAPQKSLITSLYSVFAIRNTEELEAFFTQHHLSYSKYFSAALQQQLLEIDFSKSVLVILAKPDLSRVVIEHAEVDQEELSELQQALLYSELQSTPSRDDTLNLRVNFSYSGDADTLDQLIQPDQKWDTDFYIVPIRNKKKLSISFPQKGLVDRYTLTPTPSPKHS